jgi:adenosylcobinamide-GDP ribazoletransferase
MPALGRWAQTLATGCCHYARSDSGTGSAFVNAAKPVHAAVAAVLPFALTVWLFGNPGLVLLGVTVAVPVLWMFWIKSRIGGMTGDTIGSVGEVAEVAFLIAFASLSRGR